MIYFGFLWKPFGSLRRTKRIFRASPRIWYRNMTSHPQFYLFLLFMISYTVLITVFHVYDIRLVIQAVPSSPYRNKLRHLGKYPEFTNDSFCKGCEKLMLNGHEWKIISTIDFLILVPSATNHFELRKKIRNTWGGAPSTYQEKRVYFFLGKPENHSIQDEILKENLYYGDIIQADFIDTYYNLTYKTLSMLYWTHYRMSDGRFRPKWVFKCDDDNFIDIFEFESYLHTLDKLNGAHIICSKREEAVPSRTNKKSTWYVDYEMWAEPLWPPCCFGPAYVMTPQAISKILEVHEAATNPFIPFEDIYVTGVLARAAEVSLINYEDRIFTNYLGQEKVIVHKGLTHWNENYISERWDDIMIKYLGNNITYQNYKHEKVLLLKHAEAKASERQKLISEKVKKIQHPVLLDDNNHENKLIKTNSTSHEEELRLNEKLRLKNLSLKRHKNIQPYQF